VSGLVLESQGGQAKMYPKADKDSQKWKWVPAAGYLLVTKQGDGAALTVDSHEAGQKVYMRNNGLTEWTVSLANQIVFKKDLPFSNVINGTASGAQVEIISSNGYPESGKWEFEADSLTLYTQCTTWLPTLVYSRNGNCVNP